MSQKPSIAHLPCRVGVVLAQSAVSWLVALSVPSVLCISFHSSLDVHVPKLGNQKLQSRHGLTSSPFCGSLCLNSSVLQVPDPGTDPAHFPFRPFSPHTGLARLKPSAWNALGGPVFPSGMDTTYLKSRYGYHQREPSRCPTLDQAFALSL